MRLTDDRSQNLKRRVLDGDLPVWRLLGTFMDLVTVSLLWLVCSLPIVTVGAASAAAYDTVIHSIKRKEPGLLARFFSTLKAEFFRGMLCTVIWGLALGLWALLLVYVMSMGGAMSFLFLMNAVVLGVVTLGSLVWIFPILSRFEMSAGRASVAALRMVFARLPATLVMALGLVAAAVVCYVWLFPLMVVPGLMWYVQAAFIEPAFALYSKQHDH